MQRYFPELPNPELLFKTMTNSQRVQMCCALDIARGVNLIDEFGELFAILRSAIPKWPTHRLSFVADFAICARGKPPMRLSFINGELKELPVAAVTLH